MVERCIIIQFGIMKLQMARVNHVMMRTDIYILWAKCMSPRSNSGILYIVSSTKGFFGNSAYICSKVIYGVRTLVRH